MRVVEDDFAAVFDEAATAKERVWHMFKNGGAGGCWRELVEWDCSSFNLVHARSVGDTDVNAVGSRASIPYASLFAGIVVTSRGIDLPRGREVARVKDVVAVWSCECLYCSCRCSHG